MSPSRTHGADFGLPNAQKPCSIASAVDLWGRESLQSFHLAPSLFLGRLNNACLKPTHGVADGLPINVMPVSHAVEGCTSSVLLCRHLLFLLCRLVKCSCHERPRGSQPACA